MNTATRVVASHHVGIARLSFIETTFSHFFSITLLLGILVSAFGVIYFKDFNRRLFIQYQTLQLVRQQDEVDLGKLLLEQSTWSTQDRIQQIAQDHLDMSIPKTNEVVMISE